MIFGVALLAACALSGQLLGEALGHLLGVKANVGGVGIAMLFLIAARLWLRAQGRYDDAFGRGIGFWSALYIPIVVAMAAQQDVIGALEGGPVVLAVATGAVLICFAAVALISRLSGGDETMDEIEARGVAAPTRSDLSPSPVRSREAGQ